MFLNLYGCEAVGHKLKNGLKTQKRHFLPVLDLMSDSLMTILVEPKQCPSHQSILLTQGPIHQIFTKKFWELTILKNALFLSRPFWFFFAFFPWKLVKVYWLARMAQNFDQAKRDNTFWPTPNILGGSVRVPPLKKEILN